jgi:uncharacterized membrane protein
VNPEKNVQKPGKQSNTSWLSKYWQLFLFILINLFIFIVIFNTVYPIKYSAVGLYFNDASKILNGLLPYRDFTFEYPPLAAVFFLIPRLITSTYSTYSILYHGEVLIFLILGLMMLFAVAHRLGKAPWKLLSVYSLGVLAIGPIIGEQFDIFAAVMTLLAVYFFWLGKTKTSWMFLALGTMIKLYPVLIAPVFLFYYLRNRQYTRIWQGISCFVVTCLFILLPELVTGPASLSNLAEYHLSRGLQLESILSTVLLMANKLGFISVSVDFYSGSWNIVSPASEILERMSTYLLLMALFIVYILIYKQIRPGKSQFSRIGAYLLLVFLALLIFSKVLSPQYIIWLLPLLPILFVGWRSLIWTIFVLVGLLTYYVFPVRYLDLIKLDTGMTIVLFIRNMLIVLMAILTGLSLYRMKSSE